MGAGVIKNIIPVVSVYRNRCDLYVNINNKLTIFEFKSSISKLLDDFDEHVKIFDEIDYLVCWEITDDDIVNFRREGISLNETKELGLETNENKPYVYITTHYLSIGYSKPVYVIDLKLLIKQQSMLKIIKRFIKHILK